MPSGRWELVCFWFSRHASASDAGSYRKPEEGTQLRELGEVQD